MNDGGSFVRRTVSLDRATDERITELVRETKLPFSTVLRLVFGTPLSARDTFEEADRHIKERIARARLRK